LRRYPWKLSLPRFLCTAFPHESFDVTVIGGHCRYEATTVIFIAQVGCLIHGHIMAIKIRVPNTFYAVCMA